jgi:hypothetical protein
MPGTKVEPKKFTYQKTTPADPVDGHTHQAWYDESGNGGTTMSGERPHQHEVYQFRIMPAYAVSEDGNGYMSCHPGSIAFAELETIEEMEIFRSGTHNGEEFSEDDLDEIAANFRSLKDEVRPKLKITHRENQKSIAGLASYGDITDVYTKKDEDGKRRLYARIENVPKEVIEFIKERRFPERSIEIYPNFKLGTKDASPSYHNVLKAIALLGHEMPAVTGMKPIELSETEKEQKRICIGEVCFECEEKAEAYQASLIAANFAAEIAANSF